MCDEWFSFQDKVLYEDVLGVKDQAHRCDVLHINIVCTFHQVSSNVSGIEAASPSLQFSLHR